MKRKIFYLILLVVSFYSKAFSFWLDFNLNNTFFYGNYYYNEFRITPVAGSYSIFLSFNEDSNKFKLYHKLGVYNLYLYGLHFCSIDTLFLYGAGYGGEFSSGGLGLELIPFANLGVEQITDYDSEKNDFLYTYKFTILTELITRINFYLSEQVRFFINVNAGVMIGVLDYNTSFDYPISIGMGFGSEF